jgi:hypothetical protein
MPQRRLSISTIRKAISLAASSPYTKTERSKQLKISRSTLKKYTVAFEKASLTTSQIGQLSNVDLTKHLYSDPLKRAKSDRYIYCCDNVSDSYNKLQAENICLLDIWRKYAAGNQLACKYSQFSAMYRLWCRANHVKRTPINTGYFNSIRPSDLSTIGKWRHSGNRHLWERSAAIQEISSGESLAKVSRKLERSHKGIKRWLNLYMKDRLNALVLPLKKSRSQTAQQRILEQAERLIKSIHESPSLHQINRSSWSLATLSSTYETIY